MAELVCISARADEQSVLVEASTFPESLTPAPKLQTNQQHGEVAEWSKAPPISGLPEMNSKERRALLFDSLSRKMGG